MATIVENDNIKVVRYNSFGDFDIAIVNKRDNNEIIILHKDVKFLLSSITDFLMDERR